MARRSGLGKGLSALIPNEHPLADGSGPSPDGLQLLDVGLEAIRPNPYQPRSQFEESSLDELAASIREVGVLQPILVRQVPGSSTEFELIAGERRWRSARRAGLATIPAIVQHEASDLHSLEVALVENLHREDLNALEEAAAYQQLIDEFQLTHEQVAERVSKSRTTVTNTLRLLQLPASVQGAIADGRLSGGHAKALLGIADAATLEATAQRVEAEGLSVRETEELVRRVNRGEPSPVEVEAEVETSTEPPAEPGGDASVKELERLLEHHLDTSVEVHMRGRRGTISIRFADLDDLERIYRAVIGTTAG